MVCSFLCAGDFGHPNGLFVLLNKKRSAFLPFRDQKFELIFQKSIDWTDRPSLALKMQSQNRVRE